MSSYEKINDYNDLVVGQVYRVINEWIAYNYMNSCMEIFNGIFIRKHQVNENIIVVFLVNGCERHVNSVNEFYLIKNKKEE